jgi:hypothetical protein
MDTKRIMRKRARWFTPVIPAIWKMEIERIKGIKLGSPPTQPTKKPGCGGTRLSFQYPIYTGGENRRIEVQAGQGRNVRPY